MRTTPPRRRGTRPRVSHSIATIRAHYGDLVQQIVVYEVERPTLRFQPRRYWHSVIKRCSGSSAPYFAPFQQSDKDIDR